MSSSSQKAAEEISAPETAKHRGGLTIYGRSFGNYDQDIRVRMHYKEQAAE